MTRRPSAGLRLHSLVAALLLVGAVGPAAALRLPPDVPAQALSPTASASATVAAGAGPRASARPKAVVKKAAQRVPAVAAASASGRVVSQAMTKAEAKVRVKDKATVSKQAAATTVAGGAATGQPAAAATAATAATASTAVVLSAPARALQRWVRKTGDNEAGPFAVIDKGQARLWIFEPDGRVVASTAVLLGAAAGDVSVPGIGERPIKDILPHERTTPAGRFVAEPGHNAAGEDIIWVDYDAAVSMHRVRTNNTAERRLDRLASRTPADNRISYGCINVPAAFYDRYISTRFQQSRAVIYLLPEKGPLDALFNTADGVTPLTTPRMTSRMAPAALTAGSPALAPTPLTERAATLATTKGGSPVTPKPL